MRSVIPWTALTVTGLMLGSAIGVPLALPIEQFLGAMAVLPIVGAAVGAGLGVLQWLSLRRRMRGSAWWVLATSIGMSVGLTGGTVLAEISGLENRGVELFVAALLVGLTAGAFLGLAQGIVLRREAGPPGRWILVSSLGMAAGFGLGAGLAEILPGDASVFIRLAAIAVIAGILVGLTTGAEVSRLLDERPGAA